MTNHEMLAFIYANGPCTHTMIADSLGCSVARVSFCCTGMMLSGLLDFYSETSSFVYSGDSWVAQP